MKSLIRTIVGGGRKALILTLSAIFILMPLSVSAASDPADGSSAAYRTIETDGSNEHVNFRLNSYSDYTGLCCQFAKYPAASGSATVRYQGANSSYAKAVYFFGVQLGWEDSIGKTSGNNAYKLQCILQDLSGSLDYVINHPTQYTEIAYEQAVARKQVSTSCFNSYPAWDDNPARGVTVIFGDAGTDDQNFIVWRNSPVGYVKLNKISADSSITG